MRRLLLLLLLLVAAGAHAGDDGPRQRPDLDVLVPIDPREHERLHFPARRDRPPVPGTVTINGAAYVCDPDGRTFTDRDAFVAHLRGAHRTPAERIPDLLVVLDGWVHFLGE